MWPRRVHLSDAVGGIVELNFANGNTTLSKSVGGVIAVSRHGNSRLTFLTIRIISIYVTSLKLAKGSKVGIFVVQNG
jgi:hypothetical protein